jgi:hypothetical protein
MQLLKLKHFEVLQTHFEVHYFKYFEVLKYTLYKTYLKYCTVFEYLTSHVTTTSPGPNREISIRNLTSQHHPCVKQYRTPGRSGTEGRTEHFSDRVQRIKGRPDMTVGDRYMALPTVHSCARVCTDHQLSVKQA